MDEKVKKYNRYSLFPIKFPSLFKFYELQRDAFWVPAEIDFDQDVKDWRERLTDEDKYFLKHTLAFFAQADGIVLQNIDNNFSIDVNIPEASLFYGIQAGIESIHWETYARTIDTLIEDTEEKEKAFNAIENYPCIRLKADWIKKWMNNNVPFLHRLVAFTCTEGIFFSSAFASIYYYKKRGLMPGLCFSNKLIARDEGLHRDFGCNLKLVLESMSDEAYCEALSLINKLDEKGRKITESEVYEIVDEAVKIEENFVDNSLNVELIGINNESMKQYVRFVADNLLVALGLQKYYGDKNPFDWMDMISLTGKQNFFEGRVSEYKKTNDLDKEFTTTEEF